MRPPGLDLDGLHHILTLCSGSAVLLVSYVVAIPRVLHFFLSAIVHLIVAPRTMSIVSLCVAFQPAVVHFHRLDSVRLLALQLPLRILHNPLPNPNPPQLYQTPKA